MKTFFTFLLTISVAALYSAEKFIAVEDTTPGKWFLSTIEKF